MSHSATLPEKFDDHSQQFELLLNSVADYAYFGYEWSTASTYGGETGGHWVAGIRAWF